ncbi:SEFIR domain-containing protein [Orbus sturtevantii]|uniref:SEFIR domain-containing protein n=1 Tax=Orbus sturtevantii TaxID=3074109 RepID=UPI00370D7F6F
MSNPQSIKTFISYSWSSPEHEQWVLKLAEQLCENGVDVQLDKWGLKEGHDKFAFMEKMVTDSEITKVIIISDRVYAEKADDRSGGVGTETQIITPELYGKIEQNKFVIVVKEKNENNEAYVPAYYQSKIYIDLSDDEEYSKNYEQLLRWIYDRPVYQKPTIGKPPAFLFDDNIISIGTKTYYSRCVDSIRNGKSNALGCFDEYCKVFLENLENFRIKYSDISDGQKFDDIFFHNMNSLIVARNEILEIFSFILNYSPTSDFINKIHAFFEKIQIYNFAPAGVSSYHKADFENYQEISYQIFVYTVSLFIQYERFQQLSDFLSRRYVIEDRSYGKKRYRSFVCFNEGEQLTLTCRNQRLALNKVSLRATYLHEDWKHSTLSLDVFTQAEFVLYLISKIKFTDDVYYGWTPFSIIYHSKHDALNIFIKAESKIYLDKLSCLFTLEQLNVLVKAKDKIDFGNFNLHYVSQLINAGKLGSID